MCCTVMLLRGWTFITSVIPWPILSHQPEVKRLLYLLNITTLIWSIAIDSINLFSWNCHTQVQSLSKIFWCKQKGVSACNSTLGSAHRRLNISTSGRMWKGQLRVLFKPFIATCRATTDDEVLTIIVFFYKMRVTHTLHLTIGYLTMDISALTKGRGVGVPLLNYRVRRKKWSIHLCTYM